MDGSVEACELVVPAGVTSAKIAVNGYTASNFEVAALVRGVASSTYAYNPKAVSLRKIQTELQWIAESPQSVDGNLAAAVDQERALALLLQDRLGVTTAVVLEHALQVELADVGEAPHDLELVARGRELQQRGVLHRGLAELARQNRVEIGVEGTVMSGTPALRLGTDLLAGAGIRRVQGILNGTSNYIRPK